MCDLIWVTSSLAAFEAAIRVKSMHLIKSCLKTRKKREIIDLKKRLHKSSSRRSFRNSILGELMQGELMPEEALTSFNVPSAYR